MMAYREEDLIGIPFPNHSSEVLCRLNEQRREGLLCDVVLIVQDQEYHTHRSVLAACSQYFKKLFTVATDNSHEPHAVYQIDFVGPESLTAILEFAYTSTLTVTASNVKQILNAAQMLEIPCIINVCLEIMDGGGGEEGGGGEGGGGGGDRAYEEEEDEDDDDEEEEDDLEDDADESREEEQEEPEDDASEKSTQVSEPQELGALEQGEMGERGESPPCSSQQEQGQSRSERRRCQEESSEKGREPDSLEGRALKDFSIESLLQEGLYPKMPGLERGSGYSPLLPGFYPPMWAAEFPTFPQILEPHHAPHPYGPQVENTPLDLAVKKEVIQEELKEEVASGLLHRDFLKEFMGPGLGASVLPEAHLSQIKDEADLRSYLSFLSASHLGVFPPWQLEEERKLKPKASQQCPICNKVIQGAGKLPRHMRTHTGEKPYMCTICEVRFTRQDKLKIHMRKHTGERPYICLHCNSKFVHNYDLKNHLRIHTGVRPYQCEHCYKSFTRSDHLHRHLKRQSCRVSRPRRGRKPAAWRASNFLYPPPPQDPHLHQDKTGLAAGCRLLPTPLPALGARGLAERRPQGGRALEDCEGGGREAAEARLVDRSHMAGEAERKRGVFSFTLSRDDVLPHASFPFPAPPPPPSDPWTVRLDRAPPIPEAAN